MVVGVVEVVVRTMVKAGEVITVKINQTVGLGLVVVGQIM